MLGSLRRAANAGSLFLVFTVLIFTVSAQKTPEEMKNPSAAAAEETKSAGEDRSVTSNPPAKPLSKTESRKSSGEKSPAAPAGKMSDDKTIPTAADDSGTSSNSNNNSDEALDSNDATVNPDRYRPRRGMREYNFEPGIAPFDPTHYTGEKTYNTAGRKLGTAHFRIGRVLGTGKAITVTYLYGVTPLVVARANEVRNPAFISEAATPNVPRTKRETSYGVGFSPVQFRFTFFPKSQFKPFVQAGAGVHFFNKSMPIPESRRLQFSGEYGGGFILHTDRRRDRFWLFGYRYFHLSNANIGGKQWNPGYNASVFYVGYSFFK